MSHSFTVADQRLGGGHARIRVAVVCCRLIPTAHHRARPVSHLLLVRALGRALGRLPGYAGPPTLRLKTRSSVDTFVAKTLLALDWAWETTMPYSQTPLLISYMGAPESPT